MSKDARWKRKSRADLVLLLYTYKIVDYCNLGKAFSERGESRLIQAGCHRNHNPNASARDIVHSDAIPR